MCEKKQSNIYSFFNKPDGTRNSDNSNVCISLNHELVYDSKTSELPHFSSGIIRKNIQTGGGEKKTQSNKKYNLDYLKFGFIQEPGSDLYPRPLCIVYSEILCNDAMKPSKLERHLQSKHKDLVSKPIEYFERMRGDIQKQVVAMKKMTTDDKSLFKASYLVALQIAKNKKPYTIGENLIKPCMLEVCEEVLGKQAVKKLKDIPISANTIKRRIEEMAEDIEDQVIIIVKNSPFYSIQLDESTDVSNMALLLCFVRVEYEGELQEELLCSLNLPGRTTSSEIFEALNNYFLEHGIEKNVSEYVQTVLQTWLNVIQALLQK